LGQGYLTDGFTIIALSLAFGYISILISKHFAARWGLIDKPGGRKSHIGDIPLVGGIGIYSSLLLTLALGSEETGFPAHITGWVSLVFVAGLIDDRFTLAWTWRLLAQIIASIGVIWSTGMSIASLGSYPLIGDVALGGIAIPFTIFAVIGLTNAFNLVDGVDGLCGSISILSLVGIVLLGGGSIEGPDLYLITFILALVMYLSFNLQSGTKRKVFLGDAGSQTIGFLISWLLIALTQDRQSSINPSVVLWLAPIPIIETLNTIFRRARKGQHIFTPDRNHFHHQLMSTGWPPSGVLLISIVISIIGLGLGMITRFMGDAASLGLFLLFSLLILRIAEKASPPWPLGKRS